jgi:hypothetical protein
MGSTNWELNHSHQTAVASTTWSVELKTPMTGSPSKNDVNNDPAKTASIDEIQQDSGCSRENLTASGNDRERETRSQET